MRIRNRLSSDKGVSLLVEYILIAGILTVFLYFMITQLHGIFIENPTEKAMRNQFQDVGNEISNKLVDMALIAPENGRMSAKVYMPYSVGDHDYKADFVNNSGNYSIKLTSDSLDVTGYVPISNIGLEVIPEGKTFSLSTDHRITYSSSSHVAPTAVALAYPTRIEEGNNVTFDMTHSTGEGNLNFTWNFGDDDDDTYSGTFTPDNPEAALVEHKYTSEGNYTAKLTVWDSMGSDNDTINITVTNTTPDPFLYADKFITPNTAQPGEQVKVNLFLRGGGVVQEARNVSVVHVMDVSGSMDPDYPYVGEDGYSIYNSTTGSVSPSKWSGNVTVNNTFGCMRIDANSTGKDIDLWVQSPDGDFARAQCSISNGERYYVSSPTNGEWNFTVVANYSTGSDSITVEVKKKNSACPHASQSCTQFSMQDVETHSFNLQANAKSFNFTVPQVEDLKVDVDPVNGSKELHLWVEEPDGTLKGPYSSSSGYETTDANGDYTAYVVADFPYGKQEFELDVDVAKIDAAKIASKTFNSFMESDDEVGVAYFNGSGSGGAPQFGVIQSLTNDAGSANSSIDALSADGGTPMAGGIYKAQKELESNASGIPVMILLSDGNPTLTSDGENDVEEAIEEAIENATDAKSTKVNGENILIYTIGFGSDANETLLKEVATSPSNYTFSSYYYYAATTDDLKEIYQQIARDLKKKAATNVTVTDVLPSNIELSSTPEANVTTVNGNTSLQWNISTIWINQTWATSFYVTPQNEGKVETNIYGLSNVTYKTPDGTPKTINLSSGEVEVKKLSTEKVKLR